MGVRAALSDGPPLGRSTAVYVAVDRAGNEFRYEETESADIVFALTHFVELDDDVARRVTR